MQRAVKIGSASSNFVHVQKSNLKLHPLFHSRPELNQNHWKKNIIAHTDTEIRIRMIIYGTDNTAHNFNWSHECRTSHILYFNFNILNYKYNHNAFPRLFGVLWRVNSKIKAASLVSYNF